MSRHQPDRDTLRIARAIVYLARDWHFGNLVPAGAADLYTRFLYSHSPREVHRIARVRSQLFRQWRSALEYLTVPGMALHYAVRKMAIEEFVRTGIGAGARQVVILAAGFDTLAVRLHQEFPQVAFIEVDQPANQAIKRRALAGRWAPRKNLDFVAADVSSESLDTKLLNSIYVSDVPTLFVAEGLLPSMPDTQRDTLFDLIRTRGGPGNSVVFTVMERGLDGGVNFRGASWWSRWRQREHGQRLHWGPSRVELEDYLGRHGFALTQLLTSKDFRVRYLDGNPDVLLAEGEDVAVANVVKS